MEKANKDKDYYENEFIQVSTKLYKYVREEYDMYDSDIKVKYDHTHRVIEFAEQIARKRIFR